MKGRSSLAQLAHLSIFQALQVCIHLGCVISSIVRFQVPEVLNWSRGRDQRRVQAAGYKDVVVCENNVLLLFLLLLLVRTGEAVHRDPHAPPKPIVLILVSRLRELSAFAERHPSSPVFSSCSRLLLPHAHKHSFSLAHVSNLSFVS